jgi:hypothetical protein
MQKKYVKYNVLMALVLLFAICYQSLHIFTDESHHFHNEITQESSSKIHFSKGNHNDCPVCDFEFAAFLAEAVFKPNNIDKLSFNGSIFSLIFSNKDDSST